MLEWIKDRAIEPSTCVAVGVILVGAGVLTDICLLYTSDAADE